MICRRSSLADGMRLASQSHRLLLMLMSSIGAACSDRLFRLWPVRIGGGAFLISDDEKVSLPRNKRQFRPDCTIKFGYKCAAVSAVPRQILG